MISRLNTAPWIVVLIILSNISPKSTKAEMNFQDIKGVHDLIKPEYEFLSPIYGLTLIGTKTLENMRFYGNYGSKKEGLGCLDFASRIHEQLVQNQDCPQDKTAELIQRLFPSPDRVNFVANQIDSDIVSHLDPETLGSIVSQLAKVQDSELKDPKRLDALEAELKDLLARRLNPKSYYEQRRNATRGLLKQLKQKGKTNSQELDQLEQDLVLLDSELKKTKEKGRGKESDYKDLAALLIDSLKESRIQPLYYPRNFTEQILLSFFWKVTSQKEEFLPLLTGMKDHLKDPAFLNSREQQNHFLAQKYSKEDFKAIDLNSDPKLLARVLIRHPEELVFLAEQDKLESKALPPFLSFAVAKHSSLDQRAYSDCGETSIRNFFNIVLYDRSQGKFNPSFLEEYQNKNPALHIHPGLISFYSAHSDPAASGSQSARDDWSENVVSKHDGVNYLKPNQAPQCEVNAGVDNIMNLIDRLIYEGRPDGGPLSKAARRVNKLDELCKSFERPGFNLSWSLEGSSDKSKLNENNTNLKIEFSIEGKPSFIWEFHSLHFAIKQIGKAEDSWMSKIATNVAEALDQVNSQGLIQRSPLLLNWFSNEYNWEDLMKNTADPIHPEVQTHLFYSLPFGSNEVKNSVIERILRGAHTHLYRTAQRLQADLPENDIFFQRNFESALADADYPQPWGDPVPSAGNSELQYTRVSKDSGVLSKLGVSKENSFKTSWQDPRGLIWAGDVLRNSLGKEKSLNWKSAIKECFKLNKKKGRRKKVKAFYQSIESSRDLRILRVLYLHDRNEKNKELLIKKYTELKKNQVSGCFPPAFEDYLLYARDQGYLEENNKFIPKFFRNLYNRSFWSGSGDPSYLNFALKFEGVDGKLVYNEGSNSNLVRCACVLNDE